MELYDYRKEMGLTLIQLEEKTGVPRSVISRIERKEVDARASDADDLIIYSRENPTRDGEVITLKDLRLRARVA